MGEEYTEDEKKLIVRAIEYSIKKGFFTESDIRVAASALRKLGVVMQGGDKNPWVTGQ